MSVTLYGEPYWYSPPVFTAFVALREKGVAFETKLVSLDSGEQKLPAFASSITARVPALEHDGFWLAESSAIAEYVDEVFPGPRLFPGAPRERARARQIMAWIRSDLLPLREERSTETMFLGHAIKPLSAAAQASADKLIAVADRLLGKRTQLFEMWSIADADLAFTLHRLILTGHVVPANLREFAAVNWSRPSVREYVNHERPKR